MYGLVIRDAEVIDGSGRPAFKADVAVKGDRIVRVAGRIDDPAERTISAPGLVVSPGFVDIHSHSDMSVGRHPLAESKISQGVTTEVTGNCGIGPWPMVPARREAIEAFMRVHGYLTPPGGLDWTDFDSFAAATERLGLGPNLAPLAGHGTIRIAVMGADNRPPTPDEQAEMERLLEEQLAQGAFGFSTGLIYPPGSFAATEELVGLGLVAARHDALYSTHLRGEAATLMAAVEEAVRIGRESGVRVEISHFKSVGRPFWGRGPLMRETLAAARAAGVDVTADQYPYEATSTTLSMLVPGWAHAGGPAALLERLADPTLKDKIGQAMAAELEIRGGAAGVMITRLGGERNLAFTGKTVADLARAWNLEPAEAARRLLLEEKAAVGGVYFCLSPQDVETIMADDHVAIGSDGRGFAAAGAKESTHPRSYGTFPRVLGRFSRERGLMGLPAAVRKMTSLPAGRAGLAERGLVREGWYADLVVFDPAGVRDTADFASPHQYARGIEHVLVNGVAVVSEGAFTGRGGGRVLRRV